MAVKEKLIQRLTRICPTSPHSQELSRSLSISQHRPNFEQPKGQTCWLRAGSRATAAARWPPRAPRWGLTPARERFTRRQRLHRETQSSARLPRDQPPGTFLSSPGAARDFPARMPAGPAQGPQAGCSPRPSARGLRSHHSHQRPGDGRNPRGLGSWGYSACPWGSLVPSKGDTVPAALPAGAPHPPRRDPAPRPALRTALGNNSSGPSAEQGLGGSTPCLRPCPTVAPGRRRPLSTDCSPTPRKGTERPPLPGPGARQRKAQLLSTRPLAPPQRRPSCSSGKTQPRA